MKRILILTATRDIHAYCVAEGLKQKGADVNLWLTSDYPSKTVESIQADGEHLDLSIVGPELSISNKDHFDVIWFRRATLVMPQEVLHPADYNFAYSSSLELHKAVFWTISQNAFCVNPVEMINRNNKAIQHAIALQVGLHPPASLYSNDPIEIKDFISRHGGQVVYKGLVPNVWENVETGKRWSANTKLMTLEDLVDDEIMACSPGIIQEVVEKKFEIRLTIFGNFAIAVKIPSQETKRGRLDWRNAQSEFKSFDVFELSHDVIRSCKKMMKMMNLVYAAFDFIVKPGGNLVFLELNPEGQFLFKERLSGAPLLDPFCEFLLYGKEDFEYTKKSETFLDYMKMRDVVGPWMDRDAENHVSGAGYPVTLD